MSLRESGGMARPMSGFVGQRMTWDIGSTSKVMYYDIKKTEVSSYCFEICKIGKSTFLAIAIDVFNFSNVVTDCLVATTCSVAYISIDTPDCHSG